MKTLNRLESDLDINLLAKLVLETHFAISLSFMKQVRIFHTPAQYFTFSLLFTIPPFMRNPYKIIVLRLIPKLYPMSPTGT